LVVAACSSPSSDSSEVCSQEVPASGHALLQAHRAVALHTSKLGYASQVNPSGSAAPLDEVGYSAVADQCCQAEMKQFIERQAENLNLEICNPGGISGLVPYHSCEKGPQTFADLTSTLLASIDERCMWVANAGQCKEMPADCPKFQVETPSDCGCSRSQAVLLDFEKATVLQSNLGGKGPDTGVAELRYGGIAEHPAGQPFDLVITAPDGYEGDPKDNGKNVDYPKFAQVSMYGSGSPAGWSGNAKLHLSFVRPGSATPVELPEFFFTIFDEHGEDAGVVKQTVSAKGYKGHATDVNTDLLASRNPDGSTKFTAPGHKIPNPTDPMTATQAQRASMVMYFYENTSSFELTLGVEVDVNFNKKAEKWFHFAATSALSDRCAP